MALKTLMIGNSHIACLKEAASLFNFRELGDCDWMYSPGLNLVNLSISDDDILSSNNDPTLEARLKAKNSKTSVVLGNYDRIVIVGLGLNIGLLAALSRDFATDISLDLGLLLDSGMQLVSEQSIYEASLDLVANSPAFRIARLIRPSFSGFLFVIPQPNPLEHLRSLVPHNDREQRVIKRWRNCIEPHKTVELNRQFVDCLQNAGDSLNVIPIPQADETLVDGLTCSTYMRIKAKHRQPKVDIRHMNAAYGKKLLDQLRHCYSLCKV